MDKEEFHIDIDTMMIQPEKMIGQGNTAEIFQLKDNKILKLYRKGFSKYAIEREYQNSILAMKSLECVPKVYGKVCVGDRDGIVFQQIYGTDMLKAMNTTIWKIRSYSKMFTKYHSQVFCPISGDIQSVKEKLRQDIEWEMDLSDEEKKVILKYMEDLPDGDELCHFDFHPGNIILSSEGAYFIDWMNACRGDSCADIARTCLLLTYGELIHASKYRRRMFSIIKHQIYKVYIKKYLEISGKRMEDIRKWELPIAAARLNEMLTDHERQALIYKIKKLLYCSG